MGENIRLGALVDAADTCRRGNGLLRRMLCVPMGRKYGASLWKGETPGKAVEEADEHGN